MQEESERRPNDARSAEMRARLMAAARALFAVKGFAGTGTPEIVARAEVTRGALYHHFADKTDLFRAVLRAEAAAVGREIAGASGGADGGLGAGADAFFAAMRVPGRARILLVDGPAVLGQAEIDAVDADTGRARLREGLAAALRGVPAAELDALATVVSAAFDRAALAISAGAAPEPYERALSRLLAGLGRP